MIGAQDRAFRGGSSLRARDAVDRASLAQPAASGLSSPADRRPVTLISGLPGRRAGHRLVPAEVKWSRHPGTLGVADGGRNVPGLPTGGRKPCPAWR